MGIIRDYKGSQNKGEFKTAVQISSFRQAHTSRRYFPIQKKHHEHQKMGDDSFASGLMQLNIFFTADTAAF